MIYKNITYYIFLWVVFLSLTEANATVFTVTNTNDAGPGSLRQAMEDANANPGLDTIYFNFSSGSAPFTIQPLSGLPVFNDPVIIDGTSEPNYAGTPIVEIDGSNAGDKEGLKFDGGSDGSMVRALVINRFQRDGIYLKSSINHIIIGCYLGTDVSGTVALGNGRFGIIVDGQPGMTIGGTSLADRNIISGNTDGGIRIKGQSTINCTVVNNFIGTDVTGTIDLGNIGPGIFIEDAKNNTIGGTTFSHRNIISGNDAGGIFMSKNNSEENVIIGNYIGLGADGTTPLGNAFFGIRIIDDGNNNHIGGANPGEANIIAFNTGNGIQLVNNNNSIDNDLLSNRIFNNSGLAIDLNEDGYTINDAGDGDNGANARLNFPELTSSTLVRDSIYLELDLDIDDGDPNTGYRIEIFANSIDSRQGEVYVGHLDVAGDVTGQNASFLSPPGVTAGWYLTATTTEQDASLDGFGSTSEFSATSLLLGPPDLNIFTQTVDNSQPNIGDQVTFTIQVTNEGQQTATGVVVTDTFPAGVSYSTHSTSTGTFTVSGNYGDWSIGNLAVGDTVTLNITVDVNQAGLWFNTSEVTAANETDGDSTPNNSRRDEDDLGETCITVPLSLCDGNPIITVEEGASNIQWYEGGIGPAFLLAGETNDSLTITNPGEYYYTATDLNGCVIELLCPVIMTVCGVNIGDFVWEDLNGNGIQDGGEPGIDSVEVTLSGLTNSGTPVTMKDTTDINGNYSIENVFPGKYVLTYQLPSGYLFTYQDLGGDESLDSDANISTGITDSITVISGFSGNDMDVGMIRPATIADWSFFDCNQNGLQDVGESGVENVPIVLSGTDGAGNAVLLNDTTDLNGIYGFTALWPGTYTLTFGMPPGPTGLGYTMENIGADDTIDSDVNAITGQTAAITVISNQIDITIDAGFIDNNTVNPASLTACDNSNGTGSGLFFLHDANPVVTGASGVTISYHATQVDADAGLNTLISPYTSNNATVYVRVENMISGCYKTNTITLTVGVACAENCANGKDEDGDGLIDCEDPDCPCCEAYAPAISKN